MWTFLPYLTEDAATGAVGLVYGSPDLPAADLMQDMSRLCGPLLSVS